MFLVYATRHFVFLPTMRHETFAWRECGARWSDGDGFFFAQVCSHSVFLARHKNTAVVRYSVHSLPFSKRGKMVPPVSFNLKPQTPALLFGGATPRAHGAVCPEKERTHRARSMVGLTSRVAKFAERRQRLGRRSSWGGNTPRRFTDGIDIVRFMFAGMEPTIVLRWRRSGPPTNPHIGPDSPPLRYTTYHEPLQHRPPLLRYARILASGRARRRGGNRGGWTQRPICFRKPQKTLVFQKPCLETQRARYDRAKEFAESRLHARCGIYLGGRFALSAWRTMAAAGGSFDTSES